jgi:phosphate/sulfate permease
MSEIVRWEPFGIVAAWIVTVPAASVLAAGLFLTMRAIVG